MSRMFKVQGLNVNSNRLGLGVSAVGRTVLGLERRRQETTTRAILHDATCLCRKSD